MEAVSTCELCSQFSMLSGINKQRLHDVWSKAGKMWSVCTLQPWKKTGSFPVRGGEILLYTITHEHWHHTMRKSVCVCVWVKQECVSHRPTQVCVCAALISHLIISVLLLIYSLRDPRAHTVTLVQISYRTHAETRISLGCLTPEELQIYCYMCLGCMTAQRQLLEHKGVFTKHIQINFSLWENDPQLCSRGD